MLVGFVVVVMMTCKHGDIYKVVSLSGHRRERESKTAICWVTTRGRYKTSLCIILYDLATLIFF